MRIPNRGSPLNNSIDIIFVVPNQNNTIFPKNSKGKLVKILIFNKILCIIKNYIKSENFSFSFKQTFSNQKFFTIQSKTPRNISKKLIKLNNTTI